MPLYVKDVQVDYLAGRLAQLRQVSKTEAVRQALEHELERLQGTPALVERGAAFTRALLARARPADALPLDKTYIDSLYEQP